MNTKHFLLGIQLFLLLVTPIQLFSQDIVIAAFDRPNVVGPTLSDHTSNLNSVGFIRGQGLSISNGSDKFNSQGWNGPNDLSSAIQSENYVEWSISADTNFAIQLNRLNFNLSRNNTGPTQWIIQYSFDSFNTSGVNLIDEQSLGGNNTIQQFDFSNLNIETSFGGKITFRLYGWSARNPSGRMAIEGNSNLTAFSITNPGVIAYGSLLFDGLIYTSGSWSPYPPSKTTINDNAWIRDGQYIQQDGVSLQSLIINPEAELLIDKSAFLIIEENVTTSNNLIMNSDSDEYSSLIIKGTIEGDAIYRRHVNINASIGQNDLISAPVIGQTFGQFASANSNIVENPNNPTEKLFGPFNKSTGNYLTYDIILQENQNLNPAVGYRAASTDNGTFSFTGTINNSDVEIPILYSGSKYQEWNLVGNPYPSYIDVSEFLNENYSEFLPDCAGIYGYDGLASDGWTVWNLAYAEANPSAQLTPGQGFLVASKTEGGTVSFTPQMRRIGPGDDFILGRRAGLKNTYIEWLEIALTKDRKNSYTSFYLTDNASLGLDVGYDTAVFNRAAPEFSIYSGLPQDRSTTNFAIQSFGFSDLDNSSVIVPIGINLKNSSQAVVAISDTQLDSTISIVLEDRHNRHFIDLREQNAIIYPTSEFLGFGRFYLHISRQTLSIRNNLSSDISIIYNSADKVIKLENLSANGSVLKIFNTNGQLVFGTLAIKDQRAQIHLSSKNLTPGFYIVELLSDLRIQRKKIAVL